MKFKNIEPGQELNHIRRCLNACIDDKGYIDPKLLQNVFDYIRRYSDMIAAYDSVNKPEHKITPHGEKPGSYLDEKFFKSQNIVILLFNGRENKTYSIYASKFNPNKAIFFF